MMIRYKKITWLSLATLLYTAPTHSAQMNPLIKAARDGDQAAVQSLIAAGANLDVQDNNGWTPLMHATDYKHTNRAQLSIDSGYHRGNLIQLLIDAGARPNLQDNNLNTALMYAIETGNENIARPLIDAGATLNPKYYLDLQNNYGMTALMYATTTGNENIARLLIDAGANKDLQDNWERKTALMYAAQKGHENVVKLLIAAGADFELPTKHGLTPLMNAASEGHENVVQLLISAGANLDLQDSFGLTALMYAALTDHESIVQMLLKRGASLPTESQWTNRKAHLRWGSHKIEAAKQLINRNRDIIHERASAMGEYFKATKMPADIVRLIQQIGVKGLPPEQARPVPEEE